VLRYRHLGLSLFVVLVATCSVVAASSGATPRAAAPHPLSAKAWRALVAKAKQEGTVTYYSGQSTVSLTPLAAAFEKRYGIKVVINRVLDNVSRQQVNAEISTGNAIADVWELSSRAITLGALKNGWVADAVGPNLFTKRFDRKKNMVGKAVIIGDGVLGMAWNPQRVPAGVTDITDFVKPQFANGRMGLPDPAVSPTVIDFYLWLQEHYGADILTRLAAQHPKIYLGVQPLQQGIESAEIDGAPYAAGTVIADKAAGAPIEFKLPAKGAWNVPFHTMILKQAPHPAAAQLLMNYMVSQEGQSVMLQGAGSLYPNIAGTYYVTPRKQNLKEFTPAKIAAFQAKFNSLFR
jgi:iron(III) transport system substrate-binding protein